MGRGPEAASGELVEAAFGAEGAKVCDELVGLLRDRDKAVVERAARTLKKIAERDRGALYAWRKALLKEAFRAVDVRVQWNLSIVVGRLPLKGADKGARIREEVFISRPTCDLEASNPPLERHRQRRRHAVE